MPNPALRSAAALLLLPALASAQDVLGLLNNTATSFTSRGSASIPNTNPSIAFNRLDKEHYAGWGVDPANPGMRQILGMFVWVQDQIGTTPETVDMLVYGEDPALPDYPDLTAPLGAAMAIPTPPQTATAAVAFTMNVTFATPVLAPASGDVFLAMGLPQPATGAWPTDGMSCHAMYYQFLSTNGTVWDDPGPAMPTQMPNNGNGGWYVPNPANGPFYTQTPRQWRFDPIVPGATGVAGTITNQTSLTLSNAAPGTSSQASGLYPDAANPPRNAGRADDIASRWFRSTAGTGTPVLFLMDFGAFFPELPLSSVLPGSSGAICINPSGATLLGIGFTNAGQAFYPLTIPAPARTILPGTSLVHQAVALSPAGTGDAGPCTRQLF